MQLVHDNVTRCPRVPTGQRKKSIHPKHVLGIMEHNAAVGQYADSEQALGPQSGGAGDAAGRASVPAFLAVATEGQQSGAASADSHDGLSDSDEGFQYQYFSRYHAADKYLRNARQQKSTAADAGLAGPGRGNGQAVQVLRPGGTRAGKKSGSHKDKPASKWQQAMAEVSAAAPDYTSGSSGNAIASSPDGSTAQAWPPGVLGPGTLPFLIHGIVSLIAVLAVSVYQRSAGDGSIMAQGTMFYILVAVLVVSVVAGVLLACVVGSQAIRRGRQRASDALPLCFGKTALSLFAVLLVWIASLLLLS